jgi:hypothetical protein
MAVQSETLLADLMADQKDLLSADLMVPPRVVLMVGMKDQRSADLMADQMVPPRVVQMVPPRVVLMVGMKDPRSADLRVPPRVVLVVGMKGLLSILSDRCNEVFDYYFYRLSLWGSALRPRNVELMLARHDCP